MITQDELARTAERLRDALSAAADVMAECDAAEAVTPVPRRPGRLRRARAWLIPLAAAACVVAVIAVSAWLATNHARTSSSASQPAYPGSSICEPIPAAGPGTALPRFYVTTDVGARQIQLQVRRTSDCAITAVVPLPARLAADRRDLRDRRRPDLLRGRVHRQELSGPAGTRPRLLRRA